jgi:hypothetical protein
MTRFVVHNGHSKYMRYHENAFKLAMYSFHSKSSIDGLVMACYVCLPVRRGCPNWIIEEFVVCAMNVCWMSRSRCKSLVWIDTCMFMIKSMVR